uniref:Uncharacterized protein n=1 Tax=Leptocylindrus danicus TaxID=163516 RepID=A0A7S2NUH6_9STRA|mmetsp:Transcript_14371/g.21281  ORF Transcript_14371/g.21281 Transcript_14371/m.21281 type:complete len:335 (+) Transcript_14371:134-1138(+)
MKFSLAATLCVISSAAAFAPVNVNSNNAFALKSTPQNEVDASTWAADLSDTSSSSVSSEEEHMNIFPVEPTWETVQGGKTVKTYKMPQWANRAQYFIKTNGRPLDAMAQLWVGPLRNVHTMQINNQNGALTPFKATMSFKKLAPTLKISTSEHLELPITCGVLVPKPENAAKLLANTEKLWKAASPEQKKLIQGGSTMGGGGAIRSWDVPDNVNEVQMMVWSKDVGKKSFRVKIEVLQGPNNRIQSYALQCGGGSQPYHCVIQTPGPGWIVRLQNQKFVEDGLHEFLVMPYTPGGVSAPIPESGAGAPQMGGRGSSTYKPLFNDKPNFNTRWYN